MRKINCFAERGVNLEETNIAANEKARRCRIAIFYRIFFKIFFTKQKNVLARRSNGRIIFFAAVKFAGKRLFDETRSHCAGKID